MALSLSLSTYITTTATQTGAKSESDIIDAHTRLPYYYSHRSSYSATPGVLVVKLALTPIIRITHLTNLPLVPTCRITRAPVGCTFTLSIRQSSQLLFWCVGGLIIPLTLVIPHIYTSHLPQVLTWRIPRPPI